MNKIKKIFSTRYKHLLVVVAIVAASVGAFGFVDDYFEISKNLDIFTTLFRELNIYYVDETNPAKLIKKGIDSMLKSLDPYTDFIPESDIEDYRFMTTGQYGGIGSGIRPKGDYVVITDPYEGFPAQKADLRAGDLILEIDGKSVKGKNSDEVSKALKGQPRTTVKILIKREGEKNPLEKTIVREEIKIKSVPYYGVLENNVGYIKLTGFTESAGREVRDAFITLKETQNIKSLVFDLRGNPGGLLNEAVNIANIFVPRGQEIVSTKGKVKEWDKSYKALNAPVDGDMPLVVIVNSGSASASEIVSGTIQDLDRGIIIGQRTFGKGLVQTTRQLSYNTQLKVTTAKYYIPSGRCIQALDYTHRNEDGSVGKVPDTLMTAFKTKSGRLVYDGGGVAPDIAMPQQKLTNISISLLNKLLIFDYATLYKLKHPTIPPAKEFQLTEQDFNDFVSFLSDKEYDYTTKSETTMYELKDNAEKEKYFDDMEPEYEALRNKIKHNKKEDLKKNKQEIVQLLKEEIASRYYYQKGRIQVYLETDTEVKKAIETLKDKPFYTSVLNGTYISNASSKQ